MKKSKLSIGLVTSFIGALALTSCGSTATVTPSDKSVVDFIGYNSETDRLEINVDQLYREFGESKDGTTKYYNAVLESLIRYEYPKLAADENPKEPDLKKFSRIKSEALDKVKAAKQTANDNAKNNGTEPEEEWEKILKNNDVETEEDLRLKFVYELEKEAINDWYFKKHYESYEEGEKTVVGLKQEYVGVSATQGEKETSNWTQIEPTTKDVEPVFPYHVIHILVKLSADASDYNRATITQAEAEKLWDIMRHLVDGQYTFEEVAKLSDDTSSSEYGDVELMSTRTSFYNEFKLGTYAYDAILSENNKETSDVNNKLYKAFGLDKDAKIVTNTVSKVNPETGVEEIDETEENVVDVIKETMLTEVNVHLDEEQKLLPAIPFDVFRQIGLAAKEDKIGTFTPEGSQASLPRNVLFNAFLNFRSPFVITNELLKESTVYDVDYNSDEFVTFTESTYPTEADFVANFIENQGVAKDKSKLYMYSDKEPVGEEPREYKYWAYVDGAWTLSGSTTDLKGEIRVRKDSVGVKKYEFDDEEILKLKKHNFKGGKLATISDTAFDKEVLCDTNENVVIGVRSTAGIHFMVMRKSVFENTNKLAYEKIVYKEVEDPDDPSKTIEVIDEANSDKKTHTSLEDYYYTEKVPTDKDYNWDHETYVNIKNVNDSSYYTNRVNTIKNDVKSSNFDAAYDYRIYEALLNYDFGSGKIAGKIHFSDEDKDGNSVIRTNIAKTIEQLRESSKLSQEESINKAWNEYLIQLINQNEVRSEEGMYKDAFVPTTCAFSFNKVNEKEWKEGGKCYVK